jgi:hypothetical protein
MTHRFLVAIGIALLMVTAVVGVAFALPGPTTIDGNPTDWLDSACFTDPGGGDDESSPIKADITRFCVYVDSSFLYVLMAWDDTLPAGGGSSAGLRLDIDADQVYDYIVLDTIDRSSGVLIADQTRIHSCTAGDCTNGGSVCNETGAVTCSSLGVLEAVDDSATDPFAHPASGCTGTSCETLDAFVEIAIPWSVFGLAGPPAPQAFGNYGSYPSGPAQAPKDSNGENGISCTPIGHCYISTPTAILLSSSEAVAIKGPLVVLLVAFVTVMTLWFARKR